MNTIRSLAVVVAMAVAAVAAEPSTAPSTQPSTQPAMNKNQTASYGIGYYFMGRQIKEAGSSLDLEQIIQGLRDATANAPAKVTPEQFQTAMVPVQQEIAAAAEANTVKAGDAFRADNAKKPGVKVTASGLQFQSTQDGSGAMPTDADTVKVHYTGTLVDGTKFDSSLDRGQPAQFPVKGVIPGWTEALKLMKVGGKAHLVIPPDLGYGPRGTPDGSIPPNSTLVFDVELIEIVKK